MTRVAIGPDPTAIAADWVAANHDFLATKLEALRLRLRRRVLWLRRQWQATPLHGLHEVVGDEQVDWLLGGEDRGAEAAFYRQDQAAKGLSEAMQSALARATDLQHRMRQAGAPLPLPLLGSLFGLSPFEQEVLLLCLAPELDPAFAEAYAYVQDHAGRKYVTGHLAISLFGDSPAITDEGSGPALAALDCFSPQGTLRRSLLLEADASSWPGSAETARPLRLPARVADFLRGLNRLDAEVAAWLQPASPLPLTGQHAALASQVARMLADAGDGLVLVNLMGAAGAGRLAVAAALATQVQRRLMSLDLARLVEAAGGNASSRQRLFSLLRREALLLQLAYYVDMPSPDGDPVDQRRQEDFLRELAEQDVALLLVASERRWLRAQPGIALHVPKPNAVEQRALWQQALSSIPGAVTTSGDEPLRHDLKQLVQQFDLGPAAIAHAAAIASSRARLRASGNGLALDAGDLWRACREVSSPQLAQMAQRIESVFTWDDIVLPEDLLRQLREIAAQVAHRHQVYETWGFGPRLTRGRGISALFAGPSGTGKTMAAEILANALQLDLYRIDLATVVSKYIGETEKNLRLVFDAAEQSGAILFFDEADALFGKRTEVKDSHDRYANIEVNYLLQRMESYRGLAILATNRKSALDRAFLRRLRFLLDFPLPDFADRRRIWHKAFPGAAPVNGLDFAALARLEIPGGNIRNIALNAAFLAAEEATAITMEHAMWAARREYAKIDKMLAPAEFGQHFSLLHVKAPAARPDGRPSGSGVPS